MDDLRREVSGKLDPAQRAKLGQFMTPTAIADFMAGIFEQWPADAKLLDPGAGIGSLSEAFARRFFKQAPHGASLAISAYEIDPVLSGHLRTHLLALKEAAGASGHAVSSETFLRDFIAEGTFAYAFAEQRYTHAILNPPYAKINSNSDHRLRLRSIGVETVNLYAAFLALAVALVQEGGEIVAIVPRSFCNGTYFRPFREWLFERAAITRIHVFESRKKAFKEDDVLQENIILHLARGAAQAEAIVSTSHDGSFADLSERQVPFEDIVKSDDRERFIHIPVVKMRTSSELFSHTLAELGLGVSTGPVVDFRLRDYWLHEPTADAIPLLYTHHFSRGAFQWPLAHKKPNALSPKEEVTKWLMPRGWYVVTKRFSSKEERRRVVAYVLDPALLPQPFYGFENHLNVIHANKQGLDPNIARGLAVFLNSTVLDQHFRVFSGHTQVNATDLRSMRFPSKVLLVRFGKWAERQSEITQEKIDELIDTYDAD